MIFLYRVTGILLNKGKMLLSTDDYVDFWVLSGGSVKLFESSEDAIKGEFQEEIGVKIEVFPIIWVSTVDNPGRSILYPSFMVLD